MYHSEERKVPTSALDRPLECVKTIPSHLLQKAATLGRRHILSDSQRYTVYASMHSFIYPLLIHISSIDSTNIY